MSGQGAGWPRHRPGVRVQQLLGGAQGSAPRRGGYSLLTQTHVLICMLFISSQNEQEYQEHRTPFLNRTTPDLPSAPAGVLSLSDLDRLPF